MKCDTANSFLDNFLSGRLAESDAKLVSEHLGECPSCAQNYQDSKVIFEALQELEVPAAPNDFADRVIRNAIRNQPHKRPANMLTYVASGIAASFVVLFLLTFTLVDSSKTSGSSPIVLIGNEIKTVKLAIESARTVEGIKMTIYLSDNLEISGYEEMKNISWETRLEKGTNVISLPISAIAQGDGKIKASVEFREQKKIFVIDTRHETPENTRNAIKTHVKA